jgi:hypothetical protein
VGERPKKMLYMVMPFSSNEANDKKIYHKDIPDMGPTYYLEGRFGSVPLLY